MGAGGSSGVQITDIVNSSDKTRVDVSYKNAEGNIETSTLKVPIPSFSWNGTRLDVSVSNTSVSSQDLGISISGNSNVMRLCPNNPNAPCKEIDIPHWIPTATTEANNIRLCNSLSPSECATYPVMTPYYYPVFSDDQTSIKFCSVPDDPIKGPNCTPWVHVKGDPGNVTVTPETLSQVTASLGGYLTTDVVAKQDLYQAVSNAMIQNEYSYGKIASEVLNQFYDIEQVISTNVAKNPNVHVLVANQLLSPPGNTYIDSKISEQLNTYFDLYTERVSKQMIESPALQNTISNASIMCKDNLCKVSPGKGLMFDGVNQWTFSQTPRGELSLTNGFENAFVVSSTVSFPMGIQAISSDIFELRSSNVNVTSNLYASAVHANETLTTSVTANRIQLSSGLSVSDFIGYKTVDPKTEYGFRMDDFGTTFVNGVTNLNLCTKGNPVVTLSDSKAVIMGDLETTTANIKSTLSVPFLDVGEFRIHKNRIDIRASNRPIIEYDPFTGNVRLNVTDIQTQRVNTRAV